MSKKCVNFHLFVDAKLKVTKWIIKGLTRNPDISAHYNKFEQR